MASSLLRFAPRAALFISLAVAFSPARLPAQLSFSFDYSYDTNGFFTGANAWRQSYLEVAGAYVADLVSHTAMAAITQDSTNQCTAVVFDPANISNNISINGLSVAANTIVVYAGGTSFGSTNVIAYGGPGYGTVPDGSSLDWISLLLYRGNSTYRMPAVGSITFSANEAWYFDSDPSTVENFGTDIDFFSTAVHELTHLLGFGTMESWSGLVDANNGMFYGANSMALYGGAVPLDALQQHWAEGTMSLVYGTTTTQETAMDPSIYVGARKYLTDLDAAGLADIGYTLTAVPEPAAVAGLLGLVALGVALWRRHRLAA